MVFMRGTFQAPAFKTTIVCIKSYVLSMFLCYNFYIDGNIPF